MPDILDDGPAERTRRSRWAPFTTVHPGATAIAALTDSGSTALSMSRYRAHVPIFALNPPHRHERVMAAFRNVTPLPIDFPVKDSDTALQHALETVAKRATRCAAAWSC